ncbi:helix-turn-helix domain-containing protein [Actinomadura rupiterrae]|uniref:helix-turn-helix domain-containing protein n=1 Tax=Actinomadura rupiterrae TaxID=559627 RepID=UPI0020A38D15|nr:helix-turn-helix domain-containing protein [Actinomadura rupiterrae]MCP2340397.1 excisionase family DNA binding protein [Actinomadura rupiterrae]
MDRPNFMDSLVFDVNEAAEQLRVSRWTLYNLIRSNELRTVKIGRRRLVPVEALADYVEHLMEEAA